MTSFAPTFGPAAERFAGLPLLRRASILAEMFRCAMRATRLYEAASHEPRTAVRLAFHEIAG